MSNKEDIMRKIQKALSLASNNPSMEEAQTAMLMAQKLMAQHNIEMSEIKEARSAEVTVERKQVDIKEILWWKWDLAGIVADNFRCHATKTAGRSINFYGIGDDVDMCEMVFAYAVTTIIYLSKRYIRDTVEKGERLRAVPLKNSYIRGFLWGLRDAFREQIKAHNGMALVMTKPDTLVKYVKNRKFGNVAPSRQVTEHNDDAMNAGYRDGKSFDHEKKVLGQ